MVDIYINVLLGDLPNFAMAEFRVAGLPPTVIPPQIEFFHNPAASIGNVEEGINVAYNSCQDEGASGPVPLGKVTLISFDPVGEHVLSIQPRLVPSNPNFPCSLIALGNPPLFTLVCVAGGQAFLNSSRDCTVAVEERSWSEVKQLFKD